LVEAGSEKLLFDFGRGATIRLFQKRVPAPSRRISSPISIPTTSSVCPICGSPAGSGLPGPRENRRW
jgi:hypothetical protein